MNHIKAACADETDVVTCPHNDMNYLEDLCKTNRRIAYIADGVYSMGGGANIEAIKYLKNRYGLFTYLDDSHSLSATGDQGQGLYDQASLHLTIALLSWPHLQNPSAPAVA